ncbi:MAG: hypothetical protein OXI34_00755 [Chloroflexota bacterium]|nr:hypothetical protein [Chloroflexota bacterium]MDE2853719.1 hypothetical protein [Chloroflexota bacterium]MDE2947097.1 hypothetical protein [Chloroflexota bacterium]
MQANQELDSKALSASPQENNASVMKALQDNLTLFVQLIGLGVALWGPLIVIMIWMSGNFTDIRSDISNLDSKLTGQIQELDTRLTGQIQELDTRLTGQIQALDTRLTGQIRALDNKINAIGDMTVIAFTDGEISSDELVAIWDRASAS